MPSALELAAQADQWFGGTLDLRTLSSPASLAKGLLQRIGVTPPLTQFTPNIGHNTMVQWVSHLSGGWLDCAPEYIGKPTPVVPFDLRAAYALSWCLTDCWSALTADHFEEQPMRARIEVMLQHPVERALNPTWWNYLGCTLVEVLPDGEPWPVELGNLQRAYVPLTSKHPMWFPWQTVVAAAVLSGRTPHVLQAIRLVPSGKQHLHNVDVLPGIRVRAHQDPVPILVQAREQYPVLKTVVNSLTWGIFAEFHKINKSTETPGPWCFPPIAATVAAGPRLLLALLDKMVRDAGGAVVYRDTDSSYVTSPWHEIEIIDAFRSLDQGWGIWDVDPPCNILTRDLKKYILFDNEGNLLDWKESNLRGTYEDPPGHPDWTQTYHRRVIGIAHYGEPAQTYLRAPAVRRLQNKPGFTGRPGEWVDYAGPDSYLTRLRLWHRDREDHGPKEIVVTSIRYKGSAADAIKANREGRDLERLEYGRTCPECGEMLPENCRVDKVACSPRCKKALQRRKTA